MVKTTVAKTRRCKYIYFLPTNGRDGNKTMFEQQFMSLLFFGVRGKVESNEDFSVVTNINKSYIQKTLGECRFVKDINIGSDSIGRIDGLFLLLLFAWYLYKTFKANEPVEEDDSPMRPMWLATLMIVGGLLGLVAGGRLFVSSASAIASMCGVSDKFIAITVMAGGTSMPELATCIVAAFKGKGQLALGNILGSNISNILLILGGASLIRPLSFSGMTPVDLGVLVISALFLVLSYVMFIKKSLDRTEGAILLLIEAGYMWYLIANL